MKKLIIAVFAVAIAATVQASSIKWGGGIAQPNNTDELSANSVAVLLYSSSAMSAATTINGLTVGSTANNGGTVVSTYTITAGDASGWTFTTTYAGTSPDAENGFYAILIADAGDLSKASYQYMGEVSGQTAVSAPATLYYNLDWSGANGLTAGGYNVAVGAVPEPTSGLLLLLGMAGLALKRKRA